MSAGLQRASWEDRRGDTRWPARIAASVRMHLSTRNRAVAKDISASGCRLMNLRAVPPTGMVWVSLDGFAAIAGEVTWTDGDECGVRFIRRLHPAVVDHLARRSPG